MKFVYLCGKKRDKFNTESDLINMTKKDHKLEKIYLKKFNYAFYMYWNYTVLSSAWPMSNRSLSIYHPYYGLSNFFVIT